MTGKNFCRIGPRGQSVDGSARRLAAREHLAVPFDDPGRSSLAQAWHVAATLIAAGVVLDLSQLAQATDARAECEPTRAFPAHFPPMGNLQSMAAARSSAPRIMRPPGAPSLFLASRDRPAPVVDHAPASGDSAVLIAQLHDAITASHRDYLEHAAAAGAQFHTLVASAVDLWGRGGGLAIAPTPRNANPVASAPVAEKGEEPPGLRLDRRQLEFLAQGKISQIFGPLFEQQDGYARQVRMPMPPLLLVDRVTGIAGEPGSMGAGSIWTETDIVADAWYLHDGRVPPGIVIEAGQADLLLISWLGADFHISRRARLSAARL